MSNTKEEKIGLKDKLVLGASVAKDASRLSAIGEH